MKDSHAKHEKKKKPSSRAFGKDLGGIYKVVNFAHRYRIYQFTRFVPYSLVIGFSHFFTKAFFARSKKMNLRVQRDIKAFSGMRFSPGLLKRLADATFKNMGIILFDVMLKAPNYHAGNYRRLVKIEGDEYLQAALAKGKGVIMTSLHIGQFFHEVGGLVLDPRGYELVVVANMKNQMIFENLMQIPQYKRLRVVGSASFKQIKEKLANYLKMNKIVFLMHDIAGAHNLKVPFLPGEKDFLVNLPQGAIALHKATGAPILPVLTIPDGRFTKSTLKFFDPAPILAASERHRNAPDKEFHGYLSIEINMIMFPYLVNYLHCWEEIVTMGTRTFDIKLRFEKGAGFDQIVGSMRAWALAQIEGSFEPGRKDEELRAWLIQSMDSVQSAAKKEESGKQPFALQCKACINLGGLGTCDQLKKIYKVLASLASRASLASTARSVRAMIPAIDEYYHTVVE